MDRAIAARAVPFEVVVGSPHVSHGARLTFRAPRSVADCESLRIALGLPTHPWGSPAWVGLRVSRNGVAEWKRYHAVEGLLLSFDVLPELSNALVPVMASLHAERIEVYYRLGARMPWGSFAAVCTRLVGGDPPDTSIRPAAAIDAFCLSVLWDHGRMEKVTLFADDRALPDERTLSARWREELPPADREPYDAALAAVRALGNRPARGWHAMLGWSCDRNGQTSRAVSLRLRPGRRLG